MGDAELLSENVAYDVQITIKNQQMSFALEKI
jgi:hypothetical protein